MINGKTEEEILRDFFELVAQKKNGFSGSTSQKFSATTHKFRLMEFWPKILRNLHKEDSISIGKKNEQKI